VSAGAERENAHAHCTLASLRYATLRSLHAAGLGVTPGAPSVQVEGPAECCAGLGGPVVVGL
jgi:hypothetical protein